MEKTTKWWQIGVLMALVMVSSPSIVSFSEKSPKLAVVEAKTLYWVGREQAVLRSANNQYYPEWYYLKSWWVGYPMLKRACSCESWGNPDKEPRQFREDGSLLVGYPNPNDVGACQINLPLWGEKSKTLGYDVINSYFGNIGFAKWLYDKQGMNPWIYSKKCWNKK